MTAASKQIDSLKADLVNQRKSGCKECQSKVSAEELKYVLDTMSSRSVISYGLLTMSIVFYVLINAQNRNILTMTKL